MNQTLHIFKKDTRHLYPEILLNIAAMIAFACSAPLQWNFHAGRSSPSLVLVPVLLRAVLPISWLVVISRLVHDESLVGDRQFWISRPYRWQALLAAKVLFLLVFLSLPFLLMQIYLLQHAGLDISACVADLLLYQLRLAAIFFIPFFTIAAVTSTFARLTLTLLLGFLYLGALLAIGVHFTDRRLFPQSLTVFGFVLFTLVLLSLIVVQYAARKTRAVRIALLALPMLLLVLGLVAPMKLLIHDAYPALPKSVRPKWSINTEPRSDESASTRSSTTPVEDQVLVKLPLHEDNPPTGESFKVNAVAASIEAPGYRWSSAFLVSGDVERSGPQHDPSITVMIPTRVAERIRTTPVDLHLQLASTFYKAGTADLTHASAPTFQAPGHGLCPLDTDGTIWNCRYAFRLPTPMGVTMNVSSQPCDGDHSPTEAQPAASVFSSFIGSDDDWLAFDFDPVATAPIRLVLPGSEFSHPKPAYLCTGSPIAFTPNRNLRRGSFILDAHQLVIDKYAQWPR